MTRAALALAFLLWASEAAAQAGGHVSVLADVLPDVSAEAGRQTAAELRARLFVERTQDLGERLRLNLSGYVDGLLRRDGRGSATRRDAILRPGDLYLEYSAPAFDVRAGASRLVWGRLDEIQPTDVVNPIDLARFLLEGRSEARLPVAMLRGRVFLPKASTIELVAVPHFRRSRFDQLDQETSPFSLAPAGVRVRNERPSMAWRNVQGGGRFTTTSGRVDWAVSAYSGLRSFPVFVLRPSEVLETFPRFLMIGGDFETVRGPWGLRGEVAAFLRDELQSTRAVAAVPGRSVDAGIGVDRRTGNYRIAANALWAWRGIDVSDPLGRQFQGDDELERHDVSVVMAVERSFARETRRLRLFGVYDPADETVFGRAILEISLRDNLAFEASAGLFGGESLDTLGRLSRRDFVYARLKAFF